MAAHPRTKPDVSRGDRRISGVQPRDHILEIKPLCDLLLDALDERFGGTLELVDDGERRHHVVFDKGVPAQVGTAIHIEPFDKTLQRLGFTGELVDHNALEAAMRMRVILSVERLFALGPKTVFRWLPSVDLVARDLHPCNALALLMRGFRKHASSHFAKRLLNDIAHRPLVLRDEATPRLAGLTRIECAVVESLEREALTLEQLCGRGIGPEPVVRAAVYAFSRLRFFSHDDTRPPTSLPRDMRRVLPQHTPPSQRVPDNDPFTRAEVLFRRRDFESAERTLCDLLEARPQHLAAKALLAWLRAERLGPPPRLRLGETTQRYADSLRMLDDVIRTNPKLERARYWRGVLLQRSGDWHRAVNDFRAVVRLNPRNVGAQREIQRYETMMLQLDYARWRMR